MKTTFYAAIMAITGLTGCTHEITLLRSTAIQQVDVDAKTRLSLTVEGAGTRLVGVPKSAPGEPIHRVFENSEGKVLFAYDLEVGKSSADGLYHFVMKPSKTQPTFAKAREVTAKTQDTVRIELMEKPGTGEKVVDVFSLSPRNAGDEPMTIAGHLMQMHNAVYHYFHGN